MEYVTAGQFFFFFFAEATAFDGLYHEKLFIRPCKYMRTVEDNCGTPDKNCL